MAKHPSGAGMPSVGLPWRQVRIESIHETKAQVIDKYGAHIAVSTLYRRGGGAFPREGEVWIIDRSLGFWTFAAKVVALPPVVQGSTGGVPAVEALLHALAEADLIINSSDTKSTSAYSGNTWASLGSVQYRKIIGGVVLLRGTTGTGSVGTLPVGFRPSANLTLMGLANPAKIVGTQGADSAGNSEGAITFTPTNVWGVFPVTVSTGGAITTIGPTVVDQCFFLAEP